MNDTLAPAMPRKTELTIDRLRVPLSNLDKVLYPAGKFTKAQVIDYYIRIAPLILPHLKNRPVTLKRFPDGIYGEAFYEKDAPSFTPEWVQRVPVPRRDQSREPIQYIMVNDLRTLVWLANLACLELHPFLHRAPDLDSPTHVVFDLDPGEGMDVLACAEVTFLLKDLLHELTLQCFPKVSGSKGIQVYVPLNTRSNYTSAQPFARAVAELLARQHPDCVVSEMAKDLRRGKVFIDWSQNADHKTTISVYSLRAKSEHPYVSLPVTWDELDSALRKNTPEALYWEADQALARVNKLGDLFAPVRKLKQKLPAAFHTTSQSVLPQPRSLGTYEAKRNFSRTSEPAPAVSPSRSAQGSRRRFVVQKHAASHLHYDFRLEMHDVLKSWAVPKGLPLKEGDTTAGFATEDHPLDYLQFEGTIPKGEYGGGTVMVWDIGTYEVVVGNYWKGYLVVHLAGEKLKGEWKLERKQTDDGKSRWLLTKTNGNARRIQPRVEKVSAISGKTMEQIAAERGAVWHSNRTLTASEEPTTGLKTDALTASRPPALGQQSSAEAGEPRASSRPSGRKKRDYHRAPVQNQNPTLKTVPRFIPPMKASLVKELPTGEQWLYEVKWDGYRALALKNGDTAHLLSLKNKSLDTDFPGLLKAVNQLPVTAALLDGEVVAVDAQGKPSFQALQNRKSLGRDWHLVYYAFDLLNLQGEDLTGRPLQYRRDMLHPLLNGTPLRFSAELTGPPAAILKAVRKAGLEGVIAKRRDSTYRAGSRVETWLKLKLDKSQEFVIGGYNPDGKNFQSLLVGYYEDHKLIFAGKVRQGFTPASRASLYKTMQPLRAAKCPFANLPTSKKGHFGEGVTAEEMDKLVWLKPSLVAQCAFTEFTNYRLLRHATFLGLREDKDPGEVVREVPPAQSGLLSLTYNRPDSAEGNERKTRRA